VEREGVEGIGRGRLVFGKRDKGWRGRERSEGARGVGPIS